LPRELVEQRRGVIPRRVGVMAQNCGCQSIKWLGRASRCGGDM
jgi:predicted ATP-dependent serine protease